MDSIIDSAFDGNALVQINGCHSNADISGHCGYCKGKTKKMSDCKWGITSPKMSVNDY